MYDHVVRLVLAKTGQHHQAARMSKEKKETRGSVEMSEWKSNETLPKRSRIPKSAPERENENVIF